jgi:hypothetical protein
MIIVADTSPPLHLGRIRRPEGVSCRDDPARSRLGILHRGAVCEAALLVFADDQAKPPMTTKVTRCVVKVRMIAGPTSRRREVDLDLTVAMQIAYALGIGVAIGLERSFGTLLDRGEASSVDDSKHGDGAVVAA